MLKVLFLGSRPLGKLALELIMKQKGIEIVGVCVKDKYENSYWDADPSDITGFKRFSLEDLYSLDFDIAISVNYWKVVPKDLLEKPRLGFFNVHHSYNLTYRGLNIATQAILEARKQNQWFHGTTLHKMAETLDDGQIVASDSCELFETDTAFDLFKRVERLSSKMMTTWLPRILTQKIVCVEPCCRFTNLPAGIVVNVTSDVIGTDNIDKLTLLYSAVLPAG